MAEEPQVRRIVRRMGSTNGKVTKASKSPSRSPGSRSAETDDTMNVHGGWTDGQAQMDATSPFAQAFKPDSKSEIIKFLDDTPYANFRRHWVDRANPLAGQPPVRRAYVCLQTVKKDCPLCDIGDKVQGVSAFNIVLIGDDGQLILKTWDVGARLFQTLKAYQQDPKIGPLSKHYFLVSKTGGGGGRSTQGQVQINVIPVKTNALFEDYNTEPVPQEELDAVKKYDKSVLDIPTRKVLNEIAAEIADEYD